MNVMQSLIMKQILRRVCAFSFGLAIVVAVQSNARAELIYGIAESGGSANLITWDSATPGILESGTFISGLQSNESVLGIDFRPQTGQLYALGSTSRLYTMDPSTGVATEVGSGPFSPALNGFNFGFDFNPVIDKIRVVSGVDKNTVLDPVTGGATGVTDLFYGAGDANEGVDANVVDSAYTNAVPNAPSTQLYGLDTGLDILVTQANSAGTLATVGSLGLDFTAVGGFDISGSTGTAYAALTLANSSKSTFWSIDLATGNATGLGQIDGGLVVTAMAIEPVPEPTTAIMLASGLVGMGLIGRRRNR